jgi:hypothetical protein
MPEWARLLLGVGLLALWIIAARGARPGELLRLGPFVVRPRRP